MPTFLPTEDAADKAVKDFGIGTYDSESDDTSVKGEDTEGKTKKGKSLPDGGGSLAPDPEEWLSYPYPVLDYSKSYSTDALPGDLDCPPRGRRPADDTKDVVADSWDFEDYDESEEVLPEGNTGNRHSELPSDKSNPSSRADYYDKLTIGKAIKDIWPSEDSGAYVSQDKDESETEEDGESLPTPAKNEVCMDDFLGALGNIWSGFVMDDLSRSTGFPSEDFSEEVDYMDTDSGGSLQPFGYGPMASNNLNVRISTDLELVGELTKEFLNKNGKKNITRRNVLAFLQEKSLPQYLASDIIRCMKLRHKVHISDVMDTFPVKTASSEEMSLYRIRDQLVGYEIQNMTDPTTAAKFRRCAADISQIIAHLEKIEDRNG